MADESRLERARCDPDHRAARGEIVSIYTTKPGGLYRAMEVAAVCRAAGIICNVNGSVETGVGNLANIQFAAAAPAVDALLRRAGVDAGRGAERATSAASTTRTI